MQTRRLLRVAEDEDYSGRAECPYRKLAASVITRAIQDVVCEAQEIRKEHTRDAARWLRSKSRAWYSFESLASVLDLEPDSIRDAVFNNGEEVAWRYREMSSGNGNVANYVNGVPVRLLARRSTPRTGCSM